MFDAKVGSKGESGLREWAPEPPPLHSAILKALISGLVVGIVMVLLHKHGNSRRYEGSHNPLQPSEPIEASDWPGQYFTTKRIAPSS